MKKKKKKNKIILSPASLQLFLDQLDKPEKNDLKTKKMQNCKYALGKI